MANSLTISVPKSLRQVKLKDWQKYISIFDKNKDNEDSDFLSLKTLQIFCGLSLEDSYKIPLSSFDSILEHLGNLFSIDYSRVNQFTMKGTDGKEVTFGLIPNLDKMSYGEWVDLQSYIFNDETLHKAMAVLYRPLITGRGKDRYLIHEYKGTELMSDVMREMPLDIALGARVFFYRLATKLSKYTMDSTARQLIAEREVELKTHLEKSGERISQYMNSLMEE